MSKPLSIRDPIVRQSDGGPQRPVPDLRRDMTQYLIYFNQQWVGDHTEEWFQSRGPTSMAVMNELKNAGVLLYAGGLDEDVTKAFSADDTSGTLTITDGPYVETTEFLGGLTIIDVEDEEAARMWAGKIAVGCGWPQEVREFKSQPPGTRHIEWGRPS
jgi:hypothetical protein